MKKRIYITKAKEFKKYPQDIPKYRQASPRHHQGK